MKNTKQYREKQNQGFSLITVIIAVSFIGILGMLMLYIAVANFQMKTVDLKGKDSFYTAEQALEEIRAGLIQEAGNALSKAYIQVLETYNENLGNQEVVLDEQRQQEFVEGYIKELALSLQAPANTDQYDLNKLIGFVDYTSGSRFDLAKESLVVTNAVGKNPEMKKDVTDGILLKNLKVIYVDEKGRASVIETDIRLSVPKIQFPTPSTLPDLMNMIVVANGGIICDNKDTTKNISIQGSVYAGNLSEEDSQGSPFASILINPGASLQVSNGDKLVCQGEIDIKEKGSFTSAAETTLWAQGITLASADVSLLGKTYLADDLTVSSGENSKITIKGEYYGYGDSVSARQSYNANYFKGWSDAALSSAIVINGKNTLMDLSGLNKIMLAGKNYIAGSKVKNSSGVDIVTGESLTVKGTQLAYLVPPQLLGNGSLKNPMSYDEYIEAFGNGNEISVQRDTPVESWGGKTLADIGVDASNPVQKVFFNNNMQGQGGSVYFYLNFTDDAKASAFMQDYYNNNPTVKANMDKYLSFYFGENAGIRMKDSQAYLRYITNGNVLTYDGEKKEGSMYGASDTSADLFTQEQVNYQNMWYSLNRKMIGSYELLNTSVSDSFGNTHNETDSDRSVFDNLVNESDMVRFIMSKNSQDKTYTFQASEADGGLQALMAHNGSGEVTYYQWNLPQEEGTSGKYSTLSEHGTGETLVITSDMAQKLRLVICTGDVLIKEGVCFNGIIMAKGKITLESGASLNSAPLEAAKVFQSLSVGEDVAPKDFFWEGDKYVLGNSGIEEETVVSGQIRKEFYDLSGCISYENWKKK